MSEIEGVEIHRSALLSAYPRLIHGMSTTRGGVSPAPYLLNCSHSVGDDPANVGENRRRFLAALGVRPHDTAFTRQVHSDTIIRVGAGGTYESCDGMLTSRPGVIMAISVADCIPILLYDPATHTAAAIHAGWRGSRDRILAKGVNMLVEGFGVRPPDLVVYIGPSAGPCCYEVGEDVATAFPSGYLHPGKGSRPHLDLKSYNRDLLVERGCDPGKIETAPECTICSGGKFHSYRRDGARSGRMIATIGLRP